MSKNSIRFMKIPKFLGIEFYKQAGIFRKLKD